MTVSATPSDGKRRTGTWLWAAVVVALVLVIPMLKFLLGGGLRPIPTAPAERVGPVRELGRAWVATEVASFSYRGQDALAGVEDASLEVNTRLDVVMPTPDGGQLVIDRPAKLAGTGRARRYDADGRRLAQFTVPFGSTLFALDPAGDLWFDVASGSGTVETVVHLDRAGREVRRYPLPDKLRARFLEISPAGDVYAFTEEWLVDMKSDTATYRPVLVPVALGPGREPPADVAAAVKAGSFFDAAGRLYRVSGTTRVRSAEIPRFSAEAYDASGNVTARYVLPQGMKPVCALKDGTLVCAGMGGSPASAPGASSLGDPVGDLVELMAVAPGGSRDLLRVSPPRYVSNWAPPVFVAPDGRLQTVSAQGDDVAVLRLAPAAVVSPSASGSASRSAQLTVLFPTEPFSGDPYAASDVAVRDLFQLVYGGLVRLDGDLAPVADLAAEVPTSGNGGVSADGRTVTYRVRPGATWHDGRPVTGEDVVATWRFLRAPHPDDRPRPFPGFDLIRSVTAEGDRVVVRLSEPFGAAPEAFFPYVLPAHLLEDGTPSFLSAPVGTGPFRLVRWEDGVRWALESAEGSRGASVRRMDVRFASGDAARAVFGTARTPVIWSWMPAEQVELAKRDRVGEMSWSPTGRIWALLANGRAKQLTDAATRGALMSAYPLGKLRREVLASEGATSAPPVFARSAAAPPLAEDATAAAAALEAAGWSRDGAGRRRGEASLTVDIAVTQRENADEVTIEQLNEVLGAWGGIGVVAGREVGRQRFYGSWWQAGHLAFQDWQTALGVFPSVPDPGWGGMFDPADTPSRSNPLGMSVTRTDDAVLRRLHAEARAEPDREVRARLGSLIARRAVELGLVLPERAEVRWTGALGQVRGYRPAPYPAGEFWNANQWALGDEAR